MLRRFQDLQAYIAHINLRDAANVICKLFLTNAVNTRIKGDYRDL